MPQASRLVVILGPTASGKTALAQHLASVFRGELINADSRQVYKGMAIGTAKPIPNRITSLPQRVHGNKFPVYTIKGVCHYLFDVVEPNQDFTVAYYKKLVIATITDIQHSARNGLRSNHARSKLPILVGGSGLYIKAVIDNLEIPEVPAQKELRTRWEKKSVEKLYAMLKRVDPISAQQIDKHNKRRLIRALEVVYATGESFFGQTKKGPKLYDALQIVIDIPKEKLFQNIETRTQKMIEDGLESEVRNLVKKYGWTNVLSNTIGYKEWREYFEGKESKKEVIQEIIKNTKLLVKKQLTWFRAQKDIHSVKDEKEAEALVKNFLKM